MKILKKIDKNIKRIGFLAYEFEIKNFFLHNSDFRNFSNKELHRASLYYYLSKDINYSVYKGLNLWGVDSLNPNEIKKFKLNIY
jgi:hypothetical protein